MPLNNTDRIPAFHEHEGPPDEAHQEGHHLHDHPTPHRRSHLADDAAHKLPRGRLRQQLHHHQSQVHSHVLPPTDTERMLMRLRTHLDGRRVRAGQWDGAWQELDEEIVDSDYQVAPPERVDGPGARL